MLLAVYRRVRSLVDCPSLLKDINFTVAHNAHRRLMPFAIPPIIQLIMCTTHLCTGDADREQLELFSNYHLLINKSIHDSVDKTKVVRGAIKQYCLVSNGLDYSIVNY